MEFDVSFYESKQVLSVNGFQRWRRGLRRVSMSRRELRQVR
jgi:hypothetical protein